jgi:hypothetical protein
MTTFDILGSCASRRDVPSDGRTRSAASPSTHPNAIWSRIELPDEFRSDQAAMTVLARLGLSERRALHVMDRMSAPYLSQAQVDFVESLEASGFASDNPVAAGTCASGHSFH